MAFLLRHLAAAAAGMDVPVPFPVVPPLPPMPPSHTAPGTSFPDDGSYVLTGGDNRRVSFLDPTSGRERFQFGLPEKLFHLTQLTDELVAMTLYSPAVHLIRLSHPGRDPETDSAAPSLPVAPAHRNATIWKTLNGHANNCKSVAVSGPGAKVFVSGAQDQNVCVWSIPNGESKGVLRGHTGGVYGLAMGSANEEFQSSRCYSGSYDNSVRSWDLETMKLLRILGHHGSDVEAISLIRSLHLVASGADDSEVSFWDERTAERVGHHTCTEKVYSLAARKSNSNSSLQLLAGTTDGMIRVIDLRALGQQQSQPVVNFRAHGRGDLWDLHDSDEWGGMFYSASWGDELTKAWSYERIVDMGSSQLQGGGVGGIANCTWQFGTGQDMTGVIVYHPSFESGAVETTCNVPEAKDRIRFLLESDLSSAESILKSFVGRSEATIQSDLAMLTSRGIDEEDLLMLLFGHSDVKNTHLWSYYNLFDDLRLYRYSYLVCRRLADVDDASLICLARQCLAESSDVQITDADLFREANKDEKRRGGGDETPLWDHQDLNPFSESVIRQLRGRMRSLQRKPTFMKALQQIGILHHLIGPFPARRLSEYQCFRGLKLSSSFSELYQSRCAELLKSRACSNVVLYTKDGGEEAVHLEVLVWRSDFFYKMLSFKGSELEECKTKGRIQLENFTSTQLRTLVTIYYTGALPEDNDDVKQLSTLLRLLWHLGMHFETLHVTAVKKTVAKMVSQIPPKELTLTLLEMGWIIVEMKRKQDSIIHSPDSHQRQ